WWQYEGSSVCDYYARFEADGRMSIKEKVPASCDQSFKNTALAIGPDNSVHAIFGRNLYNLQYWVRTDAGWSVQKEPMPATDRPEAPSVGVTSAGVVLAVWKAPSPGGKTDVYGAKRLGPGNWQVEDLSPVIPDCKDGAKVDGPSLAADYSGGMRLL